ncbi:hypothetical protein AB4Z21_00580 [Paenibacillus sp. MCAF20]
MKPMSEEQQFLLAQSMSMMDAIYDERAAMLWNEEDGDRESHSTRASAHYAVGLLMRGGPGDRERACEVLHRVMDMQFDDPEEIYYGTFRTSPEAKVPPKGHFPWKSFGPGFSYYLTSTLERIADKLSGELAAVAGRDKVQTAFESAAASILPPVWASYDPNWREFIACAFAIILEHFESYLPEAVVSRMDLAMERAVIGSVERRLSDAIPMNTNIELMHLFICDYFGHRLHRAEWIAHADSFAEQFRKSFSEFGTFAEFNSSTYYGVDLTVLGFIRNYGQSSEVRRMGSEVESGLWDNIGLFYHAGLENLCGPYSRGYEMEMTAHSSLGVFLYLALGESCKHLTGVNCETSHDPLIALAGVNVPSHIVPALRSFGGERLVRKQYRELCERDDPQANSHLCTATAWLGEHLMIGAMSGSRNTSGQLHPATMHWQSEDGERYSMRMVRRETGGHWSKHMRGIVTNAEAENDKLSIQVEFTTDKLIELVFEISGSAPIAAEITEDRWRLPGLTLHVTAEAPQPIVDTAGKRLEIIYTYRPASENEQMRFVLERVLAPDSAP